MFSCSVPRLDTSKGVRLLVVKYERIFKLACDPFSRSPVGSTGLVGQDLFSLPSNQTYFSGRLAKPLDTLLGTQ